MNLRDIEIIEATIGGERFREIESLIALISGDRLKEANEIIQNSGKTIDEVADEVIMCRNAYSMVIFAKKIEGAPVEKLRSAARELVGDDGIAKVEESIEFFSEIKPLMEIKKNKRQYNEDDYSNIK